jgi:hypothetical protein
MRRRSAFPRICGTREGTQHPCLEQDNPGKQWRPLFRVSCTSTPVTTHVAVLEIEGVAETQLALVSFSSPAASRPNTLYRSFLRWRHALQNGALFQIFILGDTLLSNFLTRLPIVWGNICVDL